jgi:hypothetical protein
MDDALTLGDGTYYDRTQKWRDEAPRAVTLDGTADRLGLGMDGEDAVQAIVDYLDHNGPTRGITIVRSVFGYDERAGQKNVTYANFFKYACRHHGVLRFKADPNKNNSAAVFALSSSRADRGQA